MANHSKDIQCAGSDTWPPMLDRTDFASWQQRIRLYCQGKENRVNIPKSINEGPFQMGTFGETLAEGNEGALHLGPEQPRVYSDLSPEDKERYNTDIRATNILLQGLPKDIYTLINHYTDAKDIWDNGRFVTAVKLNRRLRESNYDQLYAYLEQHEAHANKNKMMLERFTQLNVDPLALISNVSHHQVIRIEVRGTMQGVQVQLVMGELRTELGMQIQHRRESLVFGYGMVVACAVRAVGHKGVCSTRMEPGGRWGWTLMGCGRGGVLGVGGWDRACGRERSGCVGPLAHRVIRIEVRGTMQGVQVQLVMGELRTELGMQIQVKQGRLSVTTATENGVALDEEQLLFIIADDCDAFDSDVDEAPTAHTMFMANLSSADPVYDEASPPYDSDILSEVLDQDNYQDVVCEHHEVHEMHDDVQPNYVVDSHTDYASDSNMIPYD
ncbi:hypothetical protein Tco_0996458 [Tanacetum coccineum]